MPELATRFHKLFKGDNCKKLIKYSSNEYHAELPAVEIGGMKINFGKFSNKIKKLTEVTEAARALDDEQYNLCNTLSNMKKDDPLKTTYRRIIAIAITQLSSLRVILASLQQNSSQDVEKELVACLKQMNDTQKRITDLLLPPQIPSTITPQEQLLRNPPQEFGTEWGEMNLPVKAIVGIIDKSDHQEIGLSAMQLDNIAFTGKFNGVVVRFLNQKEKSLVYNAFGMKAMEDSEVRISSRLANALGCKVEDQITIEALTVADDV